MIKIVRIVFLYIKISYFCYSDVRHALCEIENSIKMVKNNLDIMKGKLRVKIGRVS